MIGNIMDYCNNHFIDKTESGNYEFDAVNSKIIGEFTTDYYAVGSYIYVLGAKVPDNNTAFKITDVNASYLEVDGTLVDEDSTDKYTVRIISCQIPKSFIDLVSDITTYTTNATVPQGVASEKIDDYSISFGDGVKNGGGWQGAFKSRLAEFRSVFDDLRCFYGY